MHCDLIDRHNKLIDILSIFEGDALLKLNSMHLQSKYDDTVVKMYAMNLCQNHSGDLLMYFKVTIDDEPRSIKAWKTYSVKVKMYDRFAFKTDPNIIEEICSNYVSVLDMIQKNKENIQLFYAKRLVVSKNTGDVFCIDEIDFYNKISFLLRNPDRKMLVQNLQEFELRD